LSYSKKQVISAVLLTLLLVPAGLAARDGAPVQWKWSGVERLVAIGDVHGAYSSLTSLLKGSGLVSPELEWIGDGAHLVMLGDILDRGPDSRAALDLIMRLQQEALASGGRVHMLLGNHELLNLIGDYRYVSDEEFLAFAEEEPIADREAAFRRFTSSSPLATADDEKNRMEFERICPPGYFGLSRAFASDGEYGSWLLDQKILVVINDIAFVHGGLPPSLLDVYPDEINAIGMDQVRNLVEARERLLKYEMIYPELSFKTQIKMASIIRQKVRQISRTDPKMRRAAVAAEKMLEMRQGLVLRTDGPLWYRGSSLNADTEEDPVISRVLNWISARAVVVGHTPVHTGRIATRLGGKVILADTGMLQSHYKGRASAVVLASSGLFAFYPEEGLSPLPADLAGIGDGSMLADAQLESLLRAAEVVEVEEVGSGRTHPQRLSLTHQNQSYRAIFKTVDTAANPESASGNGGDRYQNEVAAYRIDRLLGLGMVPPTVLRRINGTPGSVQMWVENAVSEQYRHLEDLSPPDMTAYQQQLNRMQLLDLLILNVDRDDTNVLVTTNNWKLHLIDHSRAFGLNHEPLPLVGTSLDIDDELAARLQALDARTLRHTLGTLLSRAQIEALLERRDQLLAAGVG
jgi:hypothetical protein